MDMRIIHSQKILCTCCMEQHEVKTVLVPEHTYYKNEYVDYEATYFYCDAAEELYADEEQMRKNDIAMKDAYREKQGLLTSRQIIGIREKYDISQMDFCVVLGWDGKTITRYEKYQVQDKAHDTILKKIDEDPEWFLELLHDAKGSLSTDAYRKYLNRVMSLYEKSQDLYLRKTIEAKYTGLMGNEMFCGNTELSLEKVVDVILYFASSGKVTLLYKVKLMKLMWYADALSYKKRNYTITGLIYQALPMGAVPIGHNLIIELQNVPCEEVNLGETYAYYFHLREKTEYPALSEDDKNILDVVIDRFGEMSKNEIVEFMHREKAYVETAPRQMISFQYAESLQL